MSNADSHGQPTDPDSAESASPDRPVEAAWRACEARYRTLFDYAQVGILLCDPESRYLDANDFACRMLGYARDELIGKYAKDIVVPSEVAHIAPALREIHSRADHRREWQFRRRDGSVMTADVVATQMPDGTVLGMLRDLSDQHRAATYREHLAAIVESSQDAIIGTDLNSGIMTWNAGAEAIFGYTATEMIGTPITSLFPATRIHEESLILDSLRSGERLEPLETQRRTKDGRTIDVSVAASPVRDIAGKIIGSARIIRDISALKSREREVGRLSRLYAALSQVNQAIVWTADRDQLFEKVCQVLVDHGRFPMAWIGWYEPDTRRIVPVAAHGDEKSFLQTAIVYGDDRPEGRGPTGRAFRTGRPCISSDMLTDPDIGPWRPELKKRNLRSAATFPIRAGGEVQGTLSVYADSTDYFSDREIALLEEAAADLSFALDNFQREEARQRAEHLLRDEKRFIDTMIESMPGILYFYDAEGRFLRWNRNFETVSEYTGEEIARMHPLDFFTGDDRRRVEERVAEVFAKGESAVEAPFVTKSGQAIPHFFTGRLVLFEGQSCLVGVGIDISDRREAEERLAENERKYRELVEHANSIILRWNSEGRITFLNEFGQRFFGYSSDEIVGRHVTGTIVPPIESGGRDLSRLMDEICAAPETFEQNINENMRRNGERVWVAWTNRIERDADGRVREILSVGSDITARLQAEAEREKRHRAEEADRIKSAFLATMSHELRTPLNSIIGFTGIMLQGLAGPLNAEQTRQLDMVRSSARHLLALVNDVLDISRIEAGQLEVVREAFDLHRSLRKVVETVRPQLSAKHLNLRISFESAPREAVSDERRFEQILLNLLSNAIKFTERGEISLMAEAVPDFRRTDDADGQPAIRVHVADTGIGIQAEDLTDLFQPFRQVDSGLSRNHDGTGLGLAICRRLTDLMGGEITVKSEYGRGSTFTVTLPLRGRRNHEGQNSAH